MTLNPTIAAALIAAVVSLVVAGVTIVTARWQVRSRLDELTQAQFKDVLIKRIEVYPKLWSIPQTLLSDWERLDKPIDESWARTLLSSLIQWHSENGVFLSQPAYEAFAALRQEALEVARRSNQGQKPTLKDLQTMDLIYYKGFRPRPQDPLHVGLATCLKNDLGSYKYAAVMVQPS